MSSPLLRFFVFFRNGDGNLEELYERIENLCKKSNLTVTDVCRDCAIPRATLSDFKKGRVKSLSASVLFKIAEYFSVSVDYLMNGKQKTAEEELKFALFGGDGEVTDEMWNEVKRYAMYIKDRQNANR